MDYEINNICQSIRDATEKRWHLQHINSNISSNGNLN